MKRPKNNGYEQRRLWLGDKPTRKVKANVVYQGDNLPLLKELAPNQIDFSYCDPPFCSQAVYKSKAFDEKIDCEFNDNFAGGIHSYIHWLKPRLREIHRTLKDTGVFALHLDQRSVHYAKVELDKIFGYNNFINQLIWCYGGRGMSKKNYNKKHDVILIYSKSKEYVFNPVKRPLDPKYSGRYNKTDKNGKRFARIKNRDGSYSNIYMKTDGVILEDYWHIPFARGKEATGYPTQKPLALLDRLVKTFTDKGDMVADFFCGCGTTISSAQNLGRRWFGCDISGQAIKVIRKRMAKENSLKIEVKKTGALTNTEVLRLNPFEFESYVVGLIGIPNKKQRGDGGIDGYTYDRIPIQVKKSYKIGRPVLDSLYKHIEQRGAGIIIAHSFSSVLIEEKNKLENEKGWQIDLIETRDLLRDAS